MGAEEEQRLETKGGGPVERPRLISESQFLSWKRQKEADSSARKAEVAQKRAEDITAGTIQMNGRELFQHEPSVFDNTRY
ncbi:uncharacterized protein LOC131232772 [Magnolia sinica]|uniref:uncharacterized protein LOC131232772 n=1 Tax=Magnolia sinica TaxID=86752 RepID=UPI00265A2ECC|nr:uncharacterized protein LOC131232772 [Magnolia sinica]